MERTFLISESQLRSINQFLNDAAGEAASQALLAELAVFDGGKDVQGDALFGMSRTLRNMAARFESRVDQLVPHLFIEASRSNVIDISEVRHA